MINIFIVIFESRNNKNSGKAKLWTLIAAGATSIILLILALAGSQGTFSLPAAYAGDNILYDIEIDTDQDGENEKIVVVTDKFNSTFCNTKLFLVSTLISKEEK